MIRKIYIDGYNALRKVRRYEKLLKSNADAARRGFVESLRGRIVSGQQMCVVFDGAGEAISDVSPVQVVYSYTRTADSWIRMAVERENNPRNVLVVSSDHAVMNHARACGAETVKSEVYMEQGMRSLQQSEEEKPSDQEMSQSELEMWKRLFQVDSH